MASQDDKPARRLGTLLGAAVAAIASWRAARSRSAPSPQPPDSDVDPSERHVPANRRA
jgi:hypothetical protein